MHNLSSNDPAPTLHLVCGKIGAGKSTLSQQLALKPRHVLISEDAWLAALYPGEIHSIADYLQRAATLRNVLADHLRALLQAGVSVVLDFPFNTPASRFRIPARTNRTGPLRNRSRLYNIRDRAHCPCVGASIKQNSLPAIHCKKS